MGIIAFRDIQAIAATRDGDTPVTHLRFSKQEASDIVSAYSRLSRESKDDLLSQPEPNVVFLARAVLSQPRAAYAVLKANHAMLLREEARAQAKKKKPRNDAAKTHLRSFVFSALQKNGLAVSKAGIKIQKQDDGNISVVAPIKVGTSYTAIQRAKAYIAACYKLTGPIDLIGEGKRGEKVSLSFVVSQSKNAGMFDTLTMKKAGA